MERYICIHGHFYQPPRENPWLEAIELQDSAQPYHDWNERIHAECYARNAFSRILDDSRRIKAIVNNFSRISFNFGPTLLSWMEEYGAETYEAILAADRLSLERHGGHGAALAQAYNHTILPLATAEDKRLQLRWGIRDFERRFKRDPEGLWLPETAADVETLRMLADFGIRFTILSPYQAASVAPLGGERPWRDVRGGRVDPSTPYRVNLGGGKSIVVFFYDGPISQAVAFERLLEMGEKLAGRLIGAFSPYRSWPQLVHIATDGETYGHHHRFGEMALSYALHYIESNGLAKLTNYGEFLALHPPEHEAQIVEGSSWSCAHGVGRWRSNCGCNTGGHPGWHQAWRGPLREALDWLRGRVGETYRTVGKRVLKDPEQALDAYIGVILDRSAPSIDRFLSEHVRKAASPEAATEALELLEMERHAQLMFTSCGWFFDDIAGIETVQVLQYAARSLQLAQELSGEVLEEHFLALLKKARGNRSEYPDGQAVYEALARPAKVDLRKVGMHWAVSSVFDSGPAASRVYCYRVEPLDYQLLRAGRAKLAVGMLRVDSLVTRESETVTFGVLYLGEQNLTGGVRRFQSEEAYRQTIGEIRAAFEQGDFPELGRLLTVGFDSGTYTLKLLFRDEQRRILEDILSGVSREADAMYRRIYETNAPLLRFVASLKVPIPRHLELASGYTFQSDLEDALLAPRVDTARVRGLLNEARGAGIAVDARAIELCLGRTIDRLTARLLSDPRDAEKLRWLAEVVSLEELWRPEDSFWRAQNAFHRTLMPLHEEISAQAAAGNAPAAWLELFRTLGERLEFRL